MCVIDELFPWPWKVTAIQSRQVKGWRVESANGHSVAEYYGGDANLKAEAIIELGAQRQNALRARQ